MEITYMTKRDYFAIKILSAIISGGHYYEDDESIKSAYILADRMIKAGEENV